MHLRDGWTVRPIFIKITMYNSPLKIRIWNSPCPPFKNMCNPPSENYNVRPIFKKNGTWAYLYQWSASFLVGFSKFQNSKKMLKGGIEFANVIF